MPVSERGDFRAYRRASSILGLAPIGANMAARIVRHSALSSWSGLTLPDAHIFSAPLANRFVPRFVSPNSGPENEQCSSTWGGSATSAGKKGGRFSRPSDGGWSGRRARPPARRPPRGRGRDGTGFAHY